MPPLDNSNIAPYEEASPGLLALEPVDGDQKPERQDLTWAAFYGALESRLQALRSWRYSWWTYWARLAEFILPRRYKWLVVPNRMTRGNQINNAIIDSTTTLAMQTCAAGLWTGLTSPSRPWFKLSLGLPWANLDADGKAWLEDTEQRVYTALASSNFYVTMAQAFQDVTVFGTAPVIIYEDRAPGKILKCYLPCSGEYYLDVGSSLEVDVFYREYTLNVSQIVETFGLENCPPDVVSLWRTGGGSLQNEYVVAHSIEPNIAVSGKNGEALRLVPSHFAFREVYWLRGIASPKPLSVKGFNEKPFMAARWSTVSNDAYGRSPGMDCLGDTIQLQVMTKRKAEFVEKLVRPPMTAPVELKNQPSSIIPGQVTYVSTQDRKFEPAFMVQPQALAPMVEDIKEIQARIEKCFFVNLFMAISQMEGVQPRNELELTKRDLERLQSLGPFIEQFETEFAGPAITRVLSILQRRGMLKPMPQSLRRQPLKIEYNSIMKLAQRSSESVAMKDFFATMGELSSAAQAAHVPDPIRVVNLDKSLRKYGELNNFPSDCIFTDDEVTQHDQARQQAKAQATAPAAAMAAVSAAKTLSDTQVGNGNALDSVLRINQPGAQ